MMIPSGVSPDEWKEWQTSHVTRRAIEKIREERDRISGSFARGEILNVENPVVTHGNAARAWGQLEALNAMINFMSHKETQDY